MCSLHLSELVLLSLGVDMTSSSTQMTVAWLLGCTYALLSQHMWVIFGMNCVTFKHHLKVLAHVIKFLLPLSQQAGQ